jgi:cytochrome c oxidase subunit 3
VSEPLVRGAREAEHHEKAVHLGVGVLIASEILLFGAILALVAGSRAAWPLAFTEGVRHASKTVGSVNTLVLLVSSTAVALAVTRARGGKNARPWLLFAAALGVAFLSLKGFEYGQHVGESWVPTRAASAIAGASGVHAYVALYWLATSLHAIHVAAGVSLLAWCALRLRPPAPVHVLEAVGLYWHFVDIVWLFLWPIFYLA